MDIVFIGLVSVICGGTDFDHMEDTGRGKYDWLKKYLELPHGIPDSDTFRESIDPKELGDVLREVVSVTGSTVAIDGKTLCGSGNEEHGAYHVVSAWVAEHQITLGQEKSNKITAIPELIDMLDMYSYICGKKSEKQLDELFWLLEQVAPVSENGARELWLRAERGPIEDFGNAEELIREGNYRNKKGFIESWKANYPRISGRGPSSCGTADRNRNDWNRAGRRLPGVL